MFRIKLDLETGLYYQSAGYNYELLRNELLTGKVVQFFPTYTITSLADRKDIMTEPHTDKIVIENPSRKLEEHLREIGVRKYLRLKKLATDDTSSATVIKV